jgi:hypothetical protein
MLGLLRPYSSSESALARVEYCIVEKNTVQTKIKILNFGFEIKKKLFFSIHIINSSNVIAKTKLEITF